MTQALSYQLEDNIAHMQMDDGKANALGPALIGALSDALDRAETEASALVITGRPGRFSAGFDLKVMQRDPVSAVDMVVNGGELFLRLLDYPLPTVMALSGHAIAGGLLMAATGDRIIATEGDFRLGLNEVAAGMPVPVLAHEFARMRLRPAELTASVLHSKMYSPREAVDAGWADELTAPSHLLKTANERAKQLAALPQPAYRASKASLHAELKASIKEGLKDNLLALTRAAAP